MSTHLVETSEEDSFTAVSRHLSELLNKGQVVLCTAWDDRLAARMQRRPDMFPAGTAYASAKCMIMSCTAVCSPRPPPCSGLLGV